MLTAAYAEAKKPMTVRPSWLTARKRPGVVEEPPDAPRRAVPLLHELVHPAAPDRHEGDLGRDEEPLEEGQGDEDEDLLDGDVHAVRRRDRRGGGARLADAGRDADGELAGRDGPGDDRAGPRPGAVADLDRGDEHGVDAEEGALADGRAVLGPAVPVGGDRAGAHVRPVAELGVAEVAHVVLLDPGAEASVLELREVADLGARARRASRAGGGCTGRS